MQAAGLAAVVAGSWLSWQWDQPLWRVGELGPRFVQVALVVTGAVALVSWLPRRARDQPEVHFVTMLAALVTAVAAALVVAETPPAGQGPGGVVTATAALIVAGAGFRRFVHRRRIGPTSGPTVPRAPGSVTTRQWVGTLAGAGAAAVLLAGSHALAPSLIGTEHHRTAATEPVTGPVPALLDRPQWEVTLPAPPGQVPFAATAGGILVHQESGVLMLDPDTGGTRWHWRDEALRLRQTVVADGGQVVLAAFVFTDRHGTPPDGGREWDRVVAFDAVTGTVRWQRRDDLLTHQLRLPVPAPHRDLVFVPAYREQRGPPAVSRLGAPVGVEAIGAGDGRVRWRVEAKIGCSHTDYRTSEAGILAVVESCPGDHREAFPGCTVSGLDAETGELRWAWPPPSRVPPDRAEANRCDVAAAGDLLLVYYLVTERGQPLSEPGAVVALDPGTGEEQWVAPPAPDSTIPDGLDLPAGADRRVAVTAGYTAGTSFRDRTLLIIRSGVDGQVRAEVTLPRFDQTRRVQATGPDRVVVIGLRDESAEVVLAEVDLAAGELTGSAVLPALPADRRYAKPTVLAGPGTLAVAAVREHRRDRDDAVAVIRGYG